MNNALDRLNKLEIKAKRNRIRQFNGSSILNGPEITERDSSKS